MISFIFLLTLSSYGADVKIVKVAVEGKYQPYYFSDNYIYYANTVVYRKDTKIDIKKIDDLLGIEMAAWQGAYTDMGTEFTKRFHPGKKWLL